MKTNKQKEIAVPKSGFKRSPLPWTHDVNTTFGFGEIQPTMSQLIIPGSKTTFKPESLTRLAPMVAPTFGRVKYKTYSQFVPIDAVFPNYDQMMAQEPISHGSKTKVPQAIPSVWLGLLSSWCFHGARATLYYIDPEAPDVDAELEAGHYITEYRKRGVSDWDYSSCPHLFNYIGKLYTAGVFENLSDPYNHGNFSHMPDVGTRAVVNLKNISGQFTDYSVGDIIPLGCKSYMDLIPVSRSHEPSATNGVYIVPDYQREVTFKSADYIVEGGIWLDEDEEQPLYFAIAFEFSDFGKRIRKIIQGCGYQLDLLSREELRLDVLLAEYKAYFDVFGLTLYQGWETTWCYKLIQYIKNEFVTDLAGISAFSPSQMVGDTLRDFFYSFMVLELGNEWYTDDTDYISSHMERLSVTPKPDVQEFISVSYNGGMHEANISVSSGSGGAGSVYASQEESNSITNYTGLPYINQLQHGQVDATLLERLYYWTNKHSILGRAVRKIMDVFGLGKYIDPTHSQFIGNSDDMITISDVVSLASTAEATLGEYGGRGLSFAEGRTIVLENDKAGYWITLACIVPEAGYTQGIVPWLSAIRPMQQYQPDFDAIGMEATKKSAVVGCSYISTHANNQGGEETFGFIPRMSKFKVMYNLVNGDFNRHGLRDVYLPYTLDKQLNVNDFDVDVDFHDTIGSREFTAVAIRRSPRATDLPVAGNWARTPTKYAWLGNFTRIFRNIGEHDDNGDDISLSQLVGFADYNNDNFMLHSVLSVTCYAPCKPIEASYGLDDVDPNNVGVEYTSKA